MNKAIAITPGGNLRVLPMEGGTADPLAEKLEPIFAESSAAGLVRLASETNDQGLAPEAIYWKRFAHRFFQAICHRGEAGFGSWAETPDPGEDELGPMASEAPPMAGLEYLSVPLLRKFWLDLAAYVETQATQHSQGPAGYLQEIHPLWHFVGRVTFHLAENKKDPQRPFAFLATYTHDISRQAKVQHLPLAEALKTYAARREIGKLESLLEPVKRAAERSELVRELLDTKGLFSPQAWTVAKAYQFLRDVPTMEDAGVVVRVPNWWSARRPPRPTVQVQVGARPASRLGFDQLVGFDIQVALEGETLSKEEIAQLLENSEGLALLRGKWVEIDKAKLEEALAHWKRVQRDHPDGIGFIEGMRLLAGAPIEAKAEKEAETRAWSEVVSGPWLRETLERMRNPGPNAGCQPGRDLQATLRPYQVEGVHWLWFLTELGLGACLADDMGLGKTIQVIDLILQRRRAGKSTEPHLLVVPASLMGNWKQEFAKFAPSLRLLFVHRSECEPDQLARLAKNPARESRDFDVLITTYPMIRREDWFSKVRWSLVILDEAQAIKNASSTQTRSVKKLEARARIALTGTPVENHLGDLWSLFDFCCPGLLGSAAQFKQFAKRLKEARDMQAFGAVRRLVRPYILRRLKTDPNVAPDLPEKTELRVECGLSKRQAVLYAKTVAEFEQRLENAEGMARRGMVLSLLMQLKQLCNHPDLALSQSGYAEADSGKFDRLRSLCEPIAARQEKVLVFTQFQSMTEPLAHFLMKVFGREGLVLHGGTPVKSRPELVKRFQSEEGPPFFVISLKAGGSGLNLTAASHVVHFDRWWNPAVENQATDRAFRIGQKRNVLVHKFVCRGTFEERIDEMLRSKQALADQVLSLEESPAWTEMSDEELMKFVALDITRAETEET